MRKKVVLVWRRNLASDWTDWTDFLGSWGVKPLASRFGSVGVRL